MAQFLLPLKVWAQLSRDGVRTGEGAGVAHVQAGGTRTHVEVHLHRAAAEVAAAAAVAEAEGAVAAAHDAFMKLPYLGVGIGYRAPLHALILARPELIHFLELTAEHFFDGLQTKRLKALSGAFPLVVHGLDLSLGTPGPLDIGRVQRFQKVAAAAKAVWVSEHIAFTRAGGSDGVELGHLNAVLPTPENAKVIIEHAQELREKTGVPVILENITSDLRLNGSMREVDFINKILEEGDCGLLLDITNLYINAQNHDFSPLEFLSDLCLSRVVQLHVVGFREEEGLHKDLHADRIQEELIALLCFVRNRCPLKGILLERDERLTEHAEILDDLKVLNSIFGHPHDICNPNERAAV